MGWGAGIWRVERSERDKMTFVTDDEQRILLHAIQKAQSEGRSLLMPYSRQNKVSQNMEVTATDKSERASEKAASELSPVPETGENEEQRQRKETGDDSEQRQRKSDGDTATDEKKDMMRGKPHITDVKTMNLKIYINRKMISKLNLSKENLASKNKVLITIVPQ